MASENLRNVNALSDLSTSGNKAMGLCLTRVRSSKRPPGVRVNKFEVRGASGSYKLEFEVRSGSKSYSFRTMVAPLQYASRVYARRVYTRRVPAPPDRPPPDRPPRPSPPDRPGSGAAALSPGSGGTSRLLQFSLIFIEEASFPWSSPTTTCNPFI